MKISFLYRNEIKLKCRIRHGTLKLGKLNGKLQLFVSQISGSQIFVKLVSLFAWTSHNAECIAGSVGCYSKNSAHFYTWR